ncbi:MAG TPA: ABC transporter permease [Flavisolibacter sp.]|nr:ABC transporter permease [Flavisolibacter sp.]
MFKNYLKTAIRNLLRSKGFTLINMASLAIGITGCLVIALFVFDELKFDRFIPGGENIFRIYTERTDNNVSTKSAVVAPAIASYLDQQYPEVDTTVRILMSADKFLFEVNQKSNYEEKGWFSEASFFKLFPLGFKKGDPATCLTTPASMVITSELAERYFGKVDPIGQTIKIDKHDYTVTGVLDQLPGHFHLDFHYLMSLPSAGIAPERMKSWDWSQFYTYVRLKPGANVKRLQDKFQAYVKKEIVPIQQQSGMKIIPFFQPLQNIHLQSSDFVYDNATRGNETYVKGLSIIALFVLLIACFNFINLATARSFRRAKEIGVRKVIGADRKQLIIQFIGETVLLSVVSVAIAAIFTCFIIPYLNAFTGKSIHFNPLTHPVLALSLLASGFLVGILSGIYPAFVLSGFQPIKVLKSMKISGEGIHTGWLRKGLVVIQFALSALLIVSSVIVYRQVRYMNQKDIGFQKEQVLYFQVRGDVEKNLESFKSELKRSSHIISVTSGYGLPGDQFAGDNITVPGKDGNKNYPANIFIGDYDYIKTLGLRLIAGRDFSRAMSTDEEQAFIINETAVKDLGFDTPEKALGQRLNWDKWEPDSLYPVKEGRVVGVVHDFNYKSLHEKITTSVIQIYPKVVYKVAVKIRPDDIQSTIAYINKVWNQFSPGYPLAYQFMDESYDAMYRSEEKLGSLLWAFTAMAIVIGCMGLFALAALSAEQRIKEIGIRKVLGANMFNIIGLLSGKFLLLVLLSSFIAFPIAWWAMNNWLEGFPYRITISIWVFVFAAFTAVGIALITVSFQAIRAAMANPVKSLRAE